MENDSLREKLLEEGWNITPTALEQISENGSITDVKTIVKKLLDIDLRTVSGGTLPEDINKTKYESIEGGIVLQLQKVKNLSSPKYQEKFLTQDASITKLVLTDGVNSVQGLIMESIPHLHLNTLPGSKIFLTGQVEIAHCYLLLTKENTSFIGGRVELLVEKWELNRKLAKYKRDVQEEGGPPPWIPFGQKISQSISADKNFKSLELGKTREENAEFEAQRKDAILEASKIGAPKVFGGGNNKLLDHNVQVIVDAGFTIEQAEYALKICKNNKDRALRSLLSKHSKGKDDEKKREEKPERPERGPKGKGRGRNREEDANSLKPSGKVSLFAFLEDKLPVTEKETQPEAAGKTGKSNDQGNEQTVVKPSTDERSGRGSGRRDGHGRHEDRRHQERKFDGMKYEERRNHWQDKNDTSFGNFKLKNDFSGKAENRMGMKWNDSGRNQKPGHAKMFPRPERTYFDDENRKAPFFPPGERPPRFQKNPQIDGMHVYDSKPQYPKLPQNDFQNGRPKPDYQADSIIPQQTDYKLHHGLANLSLEQNANFHNVPEARNLTGPNVNKNMFYQNLAGVPNETRGGGPQTNFQRRSPAAFISQDLKSSYPGIPNVPDYPFKPNGTLMQGYNDFQAVFGNTARVANNNFNSPYNNPPPANFSNIPPPGHHPPPFNSGNFQSHTAPGSNYPAPFIPAQMMQQPPPTGLPQQRRWSWKKGHKCYARYWEDQNYYEALVTGVSENTCVVHFIEYGNYEEVLHDDCVPIDGISPDT